MTEYPFGGTALLSAVGRNDRAAIDALLSAGADINERSIWWAGSFGVLDSCAPDLAPFLLERGARLDAHAAARLGMMRELIDLLDADPSAVHSRGGDGKTPLHFASTPETADVLLDRGADIDARDIDHESTPAQHLIGENTNVARHLVSRGAASDILLASALGDADLVRAHLNRNPDHIRMRSNDEWFPMQDPRAGGTIYRWTLGWNKTAHTIAREPGHQALYEELMMATPPDLALCVAIVSGDDVKADALIAAHASLVKDLQEAEQLQLITMAEVGNTAAALKMVSLGWPVDMRGLHGQTALHWAAFHGDAALVQALRAKGAPVDAVEQDYGGTPVGWAEHGRNGSWFCRRGDYDATMRALS